MSNPENKSAKAKLRGLPNAADTASMDGDGNPAEIMTAEQAIEIADQYYSNGDLKSAQTLCQRILHHWPDFYLAVNLLGVIAYQGNQLEQAAQHFRQAISLEPGFSEAHFNLANILKATDRQSEAIDCYRRAIELDPAHADAHYNLANIYKAQGRTEQALECYRAAVAADPDFADAHNNAANVLKSAGRLEEAIAHYQKAINSNPQYAAAHYNLGTTLQTLERPGEAIPHYRKAIALRPDLAVAHANLGTALRMLDLLEEALPHYKQAISLQPSFLAAHNNLAALYERMNRLPEAQACNEAALAINSQDADARFLRAVLLRRLGKNAEALALFESLAEARLSGNHPRRRWYELGKLLDAQGDTSAAFDAFARGNRLHADSAEAGRTDKNRFLAKISTVSSVMDAQWLQSCKPARVPEFPAAPIFLLGFPRSGTTLLDQILDSHPGVQVMEERRIFAILEQDIETAYGAYPAALKDLDEREIARLRQRYFDTVDGYFTRDPKSCFVDKFPLNFEYLPLIHRLFPDARILFAARHPCDVVLSNFMQHYQLNDAMANFLGLEDCVHCYAEVMDLWLQCQRTLALNVTTVKYESLVSELERETRELLHNLGLEWDDAVLQFHTHAAGKDMIRTPSYEQVTQPVHSGSTMRWQNYATHLAPYLPRLEPYITAFGYSGQN
jgi:tetratricopeptide (TPR) repeat protein